MTFLNSNAIQRATRWASIFLAIGGVLIGSATFIAERQQVQDLQRESDFLKLEMQLRAFAQQAEASRREFGELQARLEEMQRRNLANMQQTIEHLPTESQARALVATFDERLKALNAQVAGFQQAGLPDLSNRVSQITDRLKKLEDAIVQDAPKAVSIIIISKELENAKKSIDDRFALQNASIDRVYNILFGSIFVIALSVISQAVSAFFGTRRQAEAKV